MSKTAILIDSTFYMSEQEINDNNFYVVPLSVNFDNLSFSEKATDPSQMVEMFYKINESKKLPQTSQPSTNDAMAMYKQIKADGYDRVISLHISGALSGTAQGMSMAAKQFAEENPGLEIEVYDSKLTGPFAANLAKTVAKVIQKHGDITSVEVEEIIEHYSKHTEVYLLVDKLDYLAYGGRIPATIASVGNLFGISPIITLNELGGLERYKAERSQKKAIMTILDKLEKMEFNGGDNVLLGSFYTTEDKMAKKFLKEANKRTDANVIDSNLSQLGIVISNHVGPGAFGLYWTKRYEIK
ncbi:DegV family protein [Mollicutes bacterium LVI A0039]|nr:DegV family protein [Mollicutes bacterium LVI A0039]